MKLILSSAVVLLSTVAKAQDFIPLCGDCWCIPDNEEGTCANKTEGIYQVGDFPEDLAVLTTFQLAEEITLQSSDGGDCSPFAPIGNDGNYNDFEYPEGFDPPCEKNPSQQGEVCGFKFIEGENDDTCNNREYTLQSYADDDAAEADGAVVMHRNGGKKN